MITKPQIALFVNTATSGEENWARIKKSTELTISMEAETEDYEYIVDEIATTELLRYKPEIEQPLKMIAGESDFEFFWDMYYNMKVGEDAKCDLLIAFMFDNTGTSDKPSYRAWRTTATVTFDELAANDSELSFTFAFGKEVKKGTVSVTGTAPDYVPVFTEGTASSVG